MEEWKDIKGFEGLYQVSTLGRVRSLDRYVKAKSASLKLIKGCIIKTWINRCGYVQVHLCKNSHTKPHLVHRLVAEAFISNPNNYPCVNHKSEKKTENNVENLEWCTYSYNTKFGTCPERRSKSLSGENNPQYGKHHSEERKRKIAQSVKETLALKRNNTTI